MKRELLIIIHYIQFCTENGAHNCTILLQRQKENLDWLRSNLLFHDILIWENISFTTGVETFLQPLSSSEVINILFDESQIKEVKNYCSETSVYYSFKRLKTLLLFQFFRLISILTEYIFCTP